jgi:hypothetical protein
MDRPQQSSASSANNNRQRRRYNGKRNSSNFSNTTAVLKVVVRNWKTLEEMEVKMAEIYSEGTFGVQFAFDEADWHGRIQAERNALKAASDWKNQQLAEAANNALEDQDLAEPAETETKSVIQGTETTAPPSASLVDCSSSLKRSSVNSSVAQITVRTLYLVPPKEISRRGKRCGLAYFVWTVSESSNNEHKDRSTLYHALEALQATNPFLETQESGSMIRIQEAVNGKAWKEPTTFPNEVGTVFQTEHYRQFVQLAQDRVEERMSRPKPSPGGGVVPSLNASTNLATVSTAATATTTNEPVATLVQYLQQKHEDEKKRKAIRRKERKKKDEVVPPAANGSSSPKPASSKSDANGSASIKKRSRRQRRKKNGKP